MNDAPQRKVRCVVYCRKSSEEGLEQQFNSLDAQRDAGLAYIASQKHEGWLALDDRYEDGGFSGGTLDRPGLKRLLADIDAGKVDCVVVYKVDRLTRSLTDFARPVDVFEARQVTFVSVTQSFNTTTSMGRLTLNVLLSFAQYERELAGERIRDKFLASRKKGMWMGGNPPLGYDVVNRRLVVNKAEAELVRMIFAGFLRLGSTTRLVQELTAAGQRTKSWTTREGQFRRGRPLDKTFIYKLLGNRVYLGDVVHKGQAYPGEHAAIIDRPTWDSVQAILAMNSHGRGNATRRATPAPLKGLIRCGACGRLYRYYVCTTAIKQGHAACPVRSVAAGEAEALVLAHVERIFKAPEIVAKAAAAAAELDAAAAGTCERDIIDALASIDTLWAELFPAEQQRLLTLLIERIEVTPTGFDLTLRAEGLRSLSRELLAAATKEPSP